MEHSKPEADNKVEVPGQDPQRKPDSKEVGQTTIANGESEAQTLTQTQNPSELPTNQTATYGSRKSVHWSPELVTESATYESDPHVTPSPMLTSSSSLKDKMDTVKNVLGRWGKRVGEATKKAEDLAGNTWQHLKTSPSFADAALGRIAQGTKVLAEGGYEKIFIRTFETVHEEKLQNSYACYLSTSAGPVMGVLYVSTAKLAFCSDNPLSYESNGKTEWSHYKVVIPLHQLKAANPSSSRVNPADKYMQVISVDDHEFWFMGFLNYDGAVGSLQDAVRGHTIQLV